MTSPYSVQMWENTGQKQLHIWTHIEQGIILIKEVVFLVVKGAFRILSNTLREKCPIKANVSTKIVKKYHRKKPSISCLRHLNTRSECAIWLICRIFLQITSGWLLLKLAKQIIALDFSFSWWFMYNEQNHKEIASYGMWTGSRNIIEVSDSGKLLQN